jgi:hypothetical protein
MHLRSDRFEAQKHRLLAETSMVKTLLTRKSTSNQQQKWRKSFALPRFSTRIADHFSTDRDFPACPPYFPAVPSR